MFSIIYNQLIKGEEKMSEEVKKFLHQQEQQKEWIKERLKACPLTKVLCQLEG